MSANFNQQLNKLNPQQREAVETIEGPVMVVAGPGTGKTQILALRIAYILAHTDASAENILCLTFTEAGVKAMRERLVKFIGNDAYKVSINTFHSFANEVIQTFSDKFAFSKELIQLDDLNRIKIIQKLLDDIATERESKKEDPMYLTPFHNRYAKQYDIISAIQVLKKESITPEDLEEKAGELIEKHKQNITERAGKPTKKWEKELEKLERLYELAKIYKKYQEELLEQGLYDYEDMIMFVIQKFEVDEELIAHYQERFLYIHVDEYQDTNGAQNKILELLGNFDKSPNIFVVGDDDQAIYRFQGANLGNILFFGSHFENVKTIPTIINYRSTQLILNIADSLIQNNQTRLANYQEGLDKKLKAFNESTQKTAEIWEFNNGDEENIYIAKKIKELVNLGESYKDIAIIFRKNSHAEDINETLNKFDVPTKLDISKDVFKTESTAKLLNLLKLISFKDENLDEIFYEVLNYDFLDLNTVDIYRISNYASRKRISILNIFISLVEPNDTELELTSLETEKIDIKEIGIKNVDKFKEFAEKLIKWHRRSKTVDAVTFVEILLTESNLLEFYSKESEDNTSFENILALTSFFDFLKQQAQLNPSKKINNILNDINLVVENKLKITLPKINSGQDAVNLLTAHGSKGLEYKHVFIIKATDNNWGSKRINSSLLNKDIYENSVEGLDEKELTLEDERRLFYVAITRAKEKVYFTYANEYVTDGTTSTPSPSQFLNELDKKYYEKFNVNDEDKYEVKKDDYVQLLKPVNKTDYSSEEKEFLLEQISKFKLSASSLNEYIASPEKFKLNRLIKVPQAKTKYMAMGTAIHFALENLNRKFCVEADNQKAEENIKVEKYLSTLIKDFENKLIKEFAGHEEFDRTLSEGKKFLEKYSEYYLENSLYKPAIEVEYNFYYHNIYLNSSNQDPIPLSGRIDKIELINKNDNSYDIKVIDYKNKEPQSSNFILGNTKASDGAIWRQLVFYKLLGDLDQQFRPKRNNKNPKYNILEAEIDFLKQNKSGKFKKEAFEIKQQDVEDLKLLIDEVMQKIRNLEFPEESAISVLE